MAKVPGRALLRGWTARFEESVGCYFFRSNDELLQCLIIRHCTCLENGHVHTKAHFEGACYPMFNRCIILSVVPPPNPAYDVVIFGRIYADCNFQVFHRISTSPEDKSIYCQYCSGAIYHTLFHSPTLLASSQSLRLLEFHFILQRPKL